MDLCHIYSVIKCKYVAFAEGEYFLHLTLQGTVGVTVQFFQSQDHVGI